MVRVVPTNDSPKNLEHRLDLDGSVHDRVGTFSKGAAQALVAEPRSVAGRGLTTTVGGGASRRRRSLSTRSPTGLVRGAVEGYPEVDDGDMHRTDLSKGGRLVGGSDPEAFDPDGCKKPWQLLGEILTLPPPVAQHQRQSIPRIRRDGVIESVMTQYRGKHRAHPEPDESTP